MEKIFDIIDIQESLKHRYPFLLIDSVVEFEENKRIVAIKNVTINEPFFEGHFPGRPVMPGVLILEAMAQAAALLSTKSSKGIDPSKTVFLVGADNVKWKGVVTPGDTLKIDVTFIKNKNVFWYFDGAVSVDGKLVAKGSLSAAAVD